VKRVLGFDIGGANLKLAHTDGTAGTVAFELWKKPSKLPAALRALVTSAPVFDDMAITMTGELCDCFETRREGVLAILKAVAKTFSRKPVKVWCTTGEFVDIATAQERALTVGSANWLALATFAGRFVPKGTALLVDIGSTTTDIIPLSEGVPKPWGRTDRDRLRSGELFYGGVRRTPACAIYPGGRVAAEVFATIQDIYLVLGTTPEDPLDHGTADGRPATIRHAHARLARMLGGDAETISLSEVVDFAALAEINHLIHIVAMMVEAGSRLPSLPRHFVLAGSGEFLARRAVKEFARWCAESRSAIPSAWAEALLAQPLRPRIISLGRKLGEALSTAACAYAVAVLAAEHENAP
jgi:probable H4MPT-linked C1 transfer pathway protein